MTTAIVFWHWLVAALVFVMLEMTAPVYFFLWLGMAAGLVGILMLAAPGELTPPYQFLLFGIVALAGFFGSRRILAGRVPASDRPTLNRRAEAAIGMAGTLSEAIEQGRGKIALGDTVWNVTGPDLPLGTRVVVTGAKGTVLDVKPEG